MRPYLVERITDSDGRLVQEFKPKVKRRVIDADVAAQVRQLMVGVTQPGGTGHRAAIAGYRVAGKTGTAQKVDPVTGGYSVDKRTASFVGFVPADHPAIVIAVVVDEPKDARYGGLVAAPVFAAVAAQTLAYLQVPPTVALAAEPLPPAPPANELPAFQPKTLAAASPTSRRMPDFRGMSYRQVLRAMQQTGLNIKLTGSGRAVAQSPAPRATVTADSEVWVRFASEGGTPIKEKRL